MYRDTCIRIPRLRGAVLLIWARMPKTVDEFRMVVQQCFWSLFKTSNAFLSNASCLHTAGTYTVPRTHCSYASYRLARRIAPFVALRDECEVWRQSTYEFCIFYPMVPSCLATPPISYLRNSSAQKSLQVDPGLPGSASQSS